MSVCKEGSVAHGMRDVNIVIQHNNKQVTGDCRYKYLESLQWLQSWKINHWHYLLSKSIAGEMLWYRIHHFLTWKFLNISCREYMQNECIFQFLIVSWPEVRSNNLQNLTRRFFCATLSVITPMVAISSTAYVNGMAHEIWLRNVFSVIFLEVSCTITSPQLASLFDIRHLPHVTVTGDP